MSEKESAPPHPHRFPNESDAYRTARNTLLRAEAELRSHVEEVAALRRTLPPGGTVPDDYVFERASPRDRIGERVRMSELFESHNALMIYSFMYGPTMARACPLCTSILDSLDGAHRHASQRAALAIVAKSPPERIASHADDRGWRDLQLLSSASNSFNADYHAENDAEDQYPLLHVFVRRDREIRHSFSTELLWVPAGEGQDGRHVDTIWPLWNLLDFTPEGRGDGWYPQLAYGPARGH